MKLLRLGAIFIILFLFVEQLLVQPIAAANSSGEIMWDAPFNVSDSPERTSTDPFLVSDPTGKAHLFWAEKMGAEEGNQPDTLLYSTWDGITWRKPVDLFFSTGGTPIVAYPRAVIDENGKIHLFWLSQPNFPNYSLNYSSSHVNQAWNPIEWKPEEILVDDLTGTKYSMDVKYRSPGELHVIFARVQQGAAPPEERSISYIRSIDYGETWSDPIEVFSFSSIEHGGSDTHLIVDGDRNIYTTWTEWDASGNGLRVWFCRSLDNGVTWEKPIVLDERIGNEYERDWSNIYALDTNKLVVMWEGGWRAYRYAQYSDDGGVSWSKPIDTFPWLIGENGTVEFARDSNNVLHLFIAQRVRENYAGYGDGTNAAVWHSTWLGERKWSEPQIITQPVNLINPKAIITGGNRVILTWYTQRDVEIMVMTGKIIGAPYVAQPQWVDTIVENPSPSITPADQQSLASSTPMPTKIAEPAPFEQQTVNLNMTLALIIGVIVIVILIIGLYMLRKNIKHT